MHPKPAGHRGARRPLPSNQINPTSNTKTQLPPRTPRNNEDSIYISTYNTLSLRTNESLAELILALENINWSIVGLSEVRRLGESIEDHGDFIFYFKGDTPGQYGIGFLIKKELRSCIEEFIGVSERIAILNLKLPPRNDLWSIVQNYSPTEQSNDAEIDIFYDQLSEAIKTHTHRKLIVMGDFNARTGKREAGEEIILGPYCSGKRTRNGEKLTQLAYENNLKILNSLYKTRVNNRWTWVSPDGRHKNEIDYILTNKSKDFIDCRVIKNLNFNSNHRMLRAKLQLHKSNKSRPFRAKQDNTKTLENTEQLKEKLEDFINATNQLKTQEKYDKFEDLLTSKETDGQRDEHGTIKWLTKETKELLKTRAELISKKEKTKYIRKEISELSKKIKQNMRRDRQKYTLELMETCIQKTGGIKKVIKKLKEKTDWIPKMKNKNNKNETKRPEIMSLATDFFRDLYAKKNQSHPTDLTRGEEVPDILPAEVDKAVRTQKKDKAPGSDGISNEFLRANKHLVVPILTHLFNEVLTNETIPDQWTTSTIILLHKKGDKNNINNYRPISLMSNIYKVFAKVILNRITKTLDENQPREQAGFRSGYSTLDHIHVVKQLFEKGKEFNITFYSCFVDYSKAFDSLEHEAIWQALKNQGVENKYIRILRNIYKNSKAKIKLEKEGKEIKLERGVRQGDPVSPKLFTAVLEGIFRQLDWETSGLTINGEHLSHLRFADDLIILSPSSKELQEMLNDLDRVSRKAGLVMNTQKTKAMTNGNKEPICINNITIDYVDEYLYLGQIISPRDATAKEIDRRIGNAWKQYWSLRDIMKNKETKMTIKRKLFNTCVMPVLTYGCQTWATTKAHNKKLATCQNAMERSMMGKKLSDRIRISNIKNHTKTKDVTVTIRKLKWKWTGHTIRGSEKWSKAIMYWFTRNKSRKRGRPSRRWVDDIKDTAGGTWSRLSKDRELWSHLEEAFVQRGTQAVE